MNTETKIRKIKQYVPPSNSDEPLIIIPAIDFIAIGAAAKKRRRQRNESIDRTALSANTSRSLLIRFEAGDCDGISYKSMYKIFSEMRLTLHVEGLPKADPSHLDISEFIKYSRSKTKITLRSISELSGIPMTTIFGIENCDVYSDFNYLAAIKILNALGHSACFVHVDEQPLLADDWQTYNFRMQSGHPMYKSPFPN